MSRFKVVNFFIFFLSAVSLNAFQADCTLESGKHFHMELTNKVMEVDWKYKVFYQANYNTWDYFENKGYVYAINKYNKDVFFVKVKNKKIEKIVKGTCVK